MIGNVVYSKLVQSDPVEANLLPAKGTPMCVFNRNKTGLADGVVVSADEKGFKGVQVVGVVADGAEGPGGEAGGVGRDLGFYHYNFL